MPPINVKSLSDQELYDMLLEMGANVGPVVASTRKLYEKKLLKLMESGGSSVQQQVEEEVEEEEIYEPEPEPEPEIVEPEFEQDEVDEGFTVIDDKFTSYRQPYVERSPPKPVYKSPGHDHGNLTRRSIRESNIPAHSSSASTSTRTPRQENVTSGAKRSKLSICLQIGLFIIVALVVFFVIQNMEPARGAHLPGLDGK